MLDAEMDAETITTGGKDHKETGRRKYKVP